MHCLSGQMLCFEVLGYVKISSIVLTLSRLWNCPTYQRKHKNKNLTGSKLLNKSLEDIFVGCTDILGILEITTGAKLIDIDVGPDPFQWSGKGDWEGVHLGYPAEKEQLKTQPYSFSGCWAVESCTITLSLSTWLLVIPQKNLLGLFLGDNWHIGWAISKVILLGIMGPGFGVTIYITGVVMLITRQYSLLYGFLSHWKSMVRLYKQPEDVGDICGHSCHSIPLPAKM